MIPDSKELGRWVKAQREKLGLTSDELATSARCSKGYINKVENAALHSSAKRPPSPTLDFLYRLSRALGTSLATPLTKLGYLNKAEADMGLPTTHPIRILHYYNGLSKEDQVLAEEMVKALWTRRHVTETAEPKTKAKQKTQKAKTA